MSELDQYGPEHFEVYNHLTPLGLKGLMLFLSLCILQVHYETWQVSSWTRNFTSVVIVNFVFFCIILCSVHAIWRRCSDFLHVTAPYELSYYYYYYYAVL